MTGRTGDDPKDKRRDDWLYDDDGFEGDLEDDIDRDLDLELEWDPEVDPEEVGSDDRGRSKDPPTGWRAGI